MEQAVAFIVEQFGASGDYGFTTTTSAASPKALLAAVKRNPHDSVAFALLLRDHGSEALRLLAEGAEESAAPASKAVLARYKALRTAVIAGVRARQARVASVVGRRKWLRHQPELRALATDVVKRASSVGVTKLGPPSLFLESARVVTGEFEELRVSVELNEGSAAARLGIGPTEPPELAGPLAQLATAMLDVVPAWEAKRRADIGRRVPSGLRRAIDRAQSGTLVLDQPTEVLTGLAAVKGASLQSWHHFQLHDWRGVLLSRGRYQDKLVADMRTRSEEDMRRILQVMAQSPAGYRAVFGDDDGSASPASVRGGLDAWAEELAVAGSTVDVDALLAAVAERLPPRPWRAFPRPGGAWLPTSTPAASTTWRWR